ncbi:glycosyl hydrolase family 28-related protein [Reichenbachiella versicolor]|uniref:glycosyl hydrolase family 28-related protein n=1 Tax=Reichenbachiella versicolor TaxID=1821036 RepID=UPI000D6EAD10|nr:glycosyl hydrolase family 28-related protein [Reichenbachiella versicolor]
MKILCSILYPIFFGGLFVLASCVSEESELTSEAENSNSSNDSASDADFPNVDCSDIAITTRCINKKEFEINIDGGIGPYQYELRFDDESIESGELLEVSSFTTYLACGQKVLSITVTDQQECQSLNETFKTCYPEDNNVLLTVDRGPRYKVAQVNNIPCQEYNQNDVVDITNYGAIGDGITDNTSVIKEVAATGKIMYIPEGTFLISDKITLLNGVYGEGKIIANQKLIFFAQQSNIFIRGIELESTLGQQGGIDVAPFLVYALNMENLEISHTTLINGRIIHRNQEEVHRKGFVFNDNYIHGDFTKFRRYYVENDLITINGIDGVEIKRNFIRCDNPNRIFKIADISSNNVLVESGAKISPYNSKNIVIEDNEIIGRAQQLDVEETTKQMADLFHGTQNITVQHNLFDVIGFTAVFENKTAIQTDFDQNSIFKNNIFKTDNLALNFLGSYGSLIEGYESGYQNIVIDNNYFEGQSGFKKDLGGIINVRHFHDVVLTNNSVSFIEQKGRMAMSFYENKAVKLSNNIIAQGATQFTNTSTDDFAAQEELIEINGNQFSDGLSTLSVGGRMLMIDRAGVKNTESTQLNVTILDNSFNQSLEPEAAAIRLNMSNFGIVNIKNNTYNNTVRSITHWTLSTFDEFNNENNSWNE